MRLLVKALCTATVFFAFSAFFIFPSIAFAAGPTYIQAAGPQNGWGSNSDPVTSAFDVVAGDVLVGLAACENGDTIVTSVSGGSLTWTRQTENSLGTTKGYNSMWSATVDSNKNMTVTFTRSNAIDHCGASVLTFRSSSGIGATTTANNGTSSGAPSISTTTLAASSAIVMVNTDWNATAGARTYVTADAGTFTETHYGGTAGVDYITEGGYYANAGVAGVKTMGLSAPATQRYAIAVVEVKGPAAAVVASPRGMALFEGLTLKVFESGKIIINQQP